MKNNDLQKAQVLQNTQDHNASIINWETMILQEQQMTFFYL